VTTSGVTPLIAGNWKMNGIGASLGEIKRLAELLAGGEPPRCRVAICPPATLLHQVNAIAAPGGIATGGQDCHPQPSGAHTGDISAQMLADAGARYVIVGHSERRADHGETSELVRHKAIAAIGAGLVPIICLGETEAERRVGRAEAVVATQFAESVPAELVGQGIVIAYEPVWAIGTGLTPTLDDIAGMHATLRRLLVERYGAAGAATPILYGGSMKPGNARDILAVENVDGGLVGGASLLANDFHAIISAI
jgi:triosephosphate isomerase